MEEIILLVDYKSSFGSKFNATPPYSGLNIEKFSIEMENFGYRIIPTYFFQINFEEPILYDGVKILYQSSEANDGFGEYKAHIDDVLYFVKLAGAKLIPDYKYFKAHSNKVFMEMLRGFMDDKNKPRTKFYGSLEDFSLDKEAIEFPVVIKESHGAQSNGVFKATNTNELYKVVEKASKSSYTFKERAREIARKLKYKENYKQFSINRSKFIVQSFTPNLTGDFKILIFNDIFYLVKRDNPPNDFRASGGGYNSFIGEFDIPEGLLNYAYEIFKNFNCPYISLDIGINNKGFNLIEFQFINFGTSAHSKSKYFIQKRNGEYELKENDLSIEFLYSYSLNSFLKQ